MVRNVFIWRILCLACLIFTGTLADAQEQEGTVQIPASEINNIQERLEELRRAGVPESRIMQIMQQEISNYETETPVPPSTDGPVNSSPQPAPGLSQTPTPPAEPKGSPVAVPATPPPAVQLPPPPKSDVTVDKMGEKDPSGIFGHSVFLRQPIVDTARRFTPPAGYIIGPGDVFTVTIYGPSELTESLTVMEDGSVRRRLFGKLYVAGLEYERARNLLEQRYRSLVDNRSVIEINLSPNPRTIGVNIVGEVSNPGYHQIPASVPAFRAILYAGGVTDIGSVRKIQVKRRGQVVHSIDIYEYLLKGTYQPFFLQDDDFIFVPIQEKVVKISGAVQRPMQYELLPNENLTDLLAFAGGLTYNAETRNVELRRLEMAPTTTASGPDREKKEFIINLDLDEVANSPSADFQLFNGDQVSIRGLEKETFNLITIEGSVEHPDEYQLFEGEKLAEVIDRAGGLKPDAFLERAYVIRTDPSSQKSTYIPVSLSSIYPDSLTVVSGSPDNITLQFKDRILVFSNNMFRERRTLTAVGRIRKPGSFEIYPGMNLKDLLYLVGGFEPDAELKSIELSLVTEAEDVDIDQLGTGDQSASGVSDTAAASLIRRISVPKNWQNAPALDTVMIYDFNRVRVYSKYDFIFTRQLTISGAVKSPGTFPVKRGMNLTDVLYMVGGLSEPSQENVIDLYRVVEFQEKGNFGTRPTEPEIKRITLKGDWRDNALADTLDVTSFYKIIVRPESEFEREGFVQVKGFVQNPGEIRVLPGMTLKDVLYATGGLRLEANTEYIELSRIIEVTGPDGEITSVPTDIRVISTTQNWQEDSTLSKIRINAFDQVFVRSDPNFRLQESVFVVGEVVTPGEYNKSSKNERLSSLIARANGITELSYLEGAYLERKNIGRIAIKLDLALKRPGSKYDLMLVEGDRLFIPARTDAVTILGNVLQPGTTVMYEKGKHSFRYYVNLAGGFARKTRKKECTVEYVDGRVKKVKRFLFVKFYPRVEQGAVLNVPRRVKEQKEEKEERDWEFQPEAVLSSATAILTFILLLDRAFGN